MYSLFLELLHIYRLMCLILAAVENIHNAQPSSISLLELTRGREELKKGTYCSQDWVPSDFTFPEKDAKITGCLQYPQTDWRVLSGSSPEISQMLSQLYAFHYIRNNHSSIHTPRVFLNHCSGKAQSDCLSIHVDTRRQLMPVNIFFINQQNNRFQRIPFSQRCWHLAPQLPFSSLKTSNSPHFSYSD